MNAKRTCLVALVMTLAGVGAARAQQYESGPYGDPTAPPAAFPAPAPKPGQVDAPVAPPTGPRLSDYILGTTPDCCGPVGGNGPISLEPYLRLGVSAMLPTNFLSKNLETGWIIDGGGRTLFFNPEGDAAWTVDLGIRNVNNHGQHSDRMAILHILETDPATQITSRVTQPVSVRALNRTFVNLGIGRECYIWNPAANCPSCGRMADGPTWRVGIEGGGRWGSEKMEFQEIQHRTEVIEGLYAAISTDLEVPCGGWVFVVGARIEYDHTWMHQILQGAPENLQEINGLVTLGLRY
jgi:hypothetical protein